MNGIGGGGTAWFINGSPEAGVIATGSRLDDGQARDAGPRTCIARVYDETRGSRQRGIIDPVVIGRNNHGIEGCDGIQVETDRAPTGQSRMVSRRLDHGDERVVVGD